MTHPYADPRYAAAFGDPYIPVHLPHSKVNILKRPIPGTEHYDAIGPYPRTPIMPEADIGADMALLQADKLVSLVLVTDVFVQPEPQKLAAEFDAVTHYKNHFLCDLAQPLAYSKHHRYEVRRAHRACEARRVEFAEMSEAWNALYAHLIAKHHISGIQAFSADYFNRIAALNPVMIGAFHENNLISAHLWFIYEGYVYSHLAASNAIGYQLGAAYAVYDFSIQYFIAQGARNIDLGAGAGTDTSSQGLRFLKEGFSNSTHPSYLCSKILDTNTYTRLSAGKSTAFFPAYRGS